MHVLERMHVVNHYLALDACSGVAACHLAEGILGTIVSGRMVKEHKPFSLQPVLFVLNVI